MTLLYPPQLSILVIILILVIIRTIRSSVPSNTWYLILPCLLKFGGVLDEGAVAQPLDTKVAGVPVGGHLQGEFIVFAGGLVTIERALGHISYEKYNMDIEEQIAFLSTDFRPILAAGETNMSCLVSERGGWVIPFFFRGVWRVAPPHNMWGWRVGVEGCSCGACR